MEPGPLQLKWIETLEQHPERQMKDVLGRKHTNDSFTCCCLGQGGLIADVCTWFEDILVPNAIVQKMKEGGVDSSELPEDLFGESYKALGLRSPTGARLESDLTALEKELFSFAPRYANKNLSLAFINDLSTEDGGTWANIAKTLRAHPEKYFTHSV